MTLTDLEKRNPEKAKAVSLDASVKNEVSDNLREYFHQVNKFFKDTLESFRDDIKTVFEPLRMVISKNLMDPHDDRVDNIREVFDDFKENLLGIFKSGKTRTDFQDRELKDDSAIDALISKLDAVEESKLLERKGGKSRIFMEDFFSELINRPDLFKNTQEERGKKQNFINVEKDLRKDDFAGLHPELTEQLLAKEYDDIKRIKNIEDELNKLRKSGYTEEEVTKSSAYKEQQSLVASVVGSKEPTKVIEDAFDNSLKKTLPTKEDRHEEQLMMSRELDEQQSQTTLLEKIYDILHQQSKPKGGILSGEAPVSTPGDESVIPPAVKTGFVAAASAAAVAALSKAKTFASKVKSGVSSVAGKTKSLLTGKGMLGRIAAPLAVASAGFEYYDEHKKIDKAKTQELEQLESALDHGQITEDEYNIARENIERDAKGKKIEEGGAGVGKLAAGLMGVKAGGLAGAKAGMFLGPKGAAVGGIIGGIIGGGVGYATGDKPGRWLASKFSGRDMTLENLDDQQKTIESIREKEIPSGIITVDDHDNTSSLADEIGRKIVVNVPQPVVIDRSPTVVSSPFSNEIHNNEQSINEFIKSRY